MKISDKERPDKRQKVNSSWGRMRYPYYAGTFVSSVSNALAKIRKYHAENDQLMNCRMAFLIYGKLFREFYQSVFILAAIIPFNIHAAIRGDFPATA